MHRRAADEAQSSYAWGSSLRSPTVGLPPRYPSGGLPSSHVHAAGSGGGISGASAAGGGGGGGGHGPHYVSGKDKDGNDIAVRTTGGLNLNGDTRELSTAETEFFAAARQRWAAQPWNYGVLKDKVGLHLLRWSLHPHSLFVMLYVKYNRVSLE
jgi:hypothetical protein